MTFIAANAILLITISAGGIAELALFIAKALGL